MAQFTANQRREWLSSLKEGDKVLYEVAEKGTFKRYGKTEPRWDRGQDRGSTGVWYEATVTIMGLNGIYVTRDDWDSNWIFTNSVTTHLLPPSYTGQSFQSKQNNDGRDTCFACDAPTRACGSLGCGPNYAWRICTACGK